ncbi:MAG TPA: alpha/beta hydrolase [Cyclobacteriaceae bacterium]|nr:alpha/beta hydrolase [Cyclobacteriaceae bacterium]
MNYWIRNLLSALGFLFTVSSFAQTPIDTALSITIGGISQYVQIKGKNRSAPLFLFLHGGPGNSAMGYAEKFTSTLQSHFVVVQWDQREAGKTKEINPSQIPLTVDLFKKDTEEIVHALLKQFHQSKLYIAGHSWGTVLGFHMARTHPEWLYAYIAISPMINQLESERIILELMKKKAKQNGNKQELNELNSVRIPFGNGAQLFYQRKWMFDYIGTKVKMSKAYVESWSSTWLNLFNTASEENLFESTPSLQCPVYFFVGRKDYQTNAELTRKYYEQLIAPKKGFYWFETAHSIPSAAPGLMQELIINEILPVTFE